MRSLTDARCAKCRDKAYAGVCIPVPVSRLENSLGHKVWQCDRCGARFKCTVMQEGQERRDR